MKTYIRNFSLSEAIKLYRFHYADMAAGISTAIKNTDEIVSRIEKQLGQELADQNILEIGPGQRAVQRFYFSKKNRYVGIDIEVPRSGNPYRNFIQDMREAGLPRAIKSGVRCVIGLDRRYAQEIARQVGSDHPPGEILKMDAAEMAFEDQTFDVAYSQSVFERLPDVASVTSEIRRILRPGGVAAILTHLYTSDSGVHGPRLFGQRGDLPYWAHLRGERSHLGRANAYLNEMRLDAYRKIFSEAWPGVKFEYFGHAPETVAALRDLRSKGELEQYTDEELLTDVLRAIWRKPA